MNGNPKFCVRTKCFEIVHVNELSSAKRAPVLRMLSELRVYVCMGFNGVCVCVPQG
jgi:hypothetical protein